MYRPQLYKILDSVFNKAIKCCTQWIYGVYKEVELGANVQQKPNELYGSFSTILVSRKNVTARK